MRLLVARHLTSLRIAISAVVTALATACSVYDGDLSTPHRSDGSAASGGSGGASSGGGGGTPETGGAGGATSGTGGTAGDGGGSTGDASLADADKDASEVAIPSVDARLDGVDTNDTADAGSASDVDSTDALPPIDADSDALDATSSDVGDGGGPAAPDAPKDAPSAPDAPPDTRDVVDSGPTGPQILPKHGAAIENPDAGGPFDSRCASDEVVTGFVGRAGVQTDAIASTCSKLVGGVLSSPHNLPLNGNTTGGNAFTVACPSNYVAVSIVGRYGHNTMWNEDVTTAIGVVCKSLTSSSTQTVTITGQPALDAGYTTFREDCTNGRYLTDISGLTDGNSLGYTVQQVGGECDYR